ncbi:MAG: hypothetical protein ABI405_00675 [Parafilimonas sp.]
MAATRMTNLNLISALFFLTAISCGQTTTSTKSNYSQSKSSSFQSNNNLDYIKFGVYCGECYGHCSTMYEYNMMGNANTLLMDTTESYFKDSGNVICKTVISSRANFDLASNVVKQIPKRLLNSFKSTDRFGCPDCTDGCGIYFEFKRQNEIKKFYIDTDTTQLPNDIKLFGKLLTTTTNELLENK